MSTTIKDNTATNDSMSVRMYGPSVEVRVVEAGNYASASVDPADLLAALRTEGILPAEPEQLTTAHVVVPADAIVILRETLPEVAGDGAGVAQVQAPDEGWGRYDHGIHASGPNSPNGRPEWHRDRAFAHLALAEYLDANPPIPVAVEEFAAAIFAARHPMERWDNTVGVVQDDYRTQALALIDAGWSK